MGTTIGYRALVLPLVLAASGLAQEHARAHSRPCPRSSACASRVRPASLRRTFNEPLSFARFRGRPAATDIRTHIRASLSTGGRYYYQTLARMQRHGPRAVEILQDEYRRASVARYLHRWLLVHTLASVEHPAAVTLFAEILRRPVPPERSRRPHAFSTTRQEVLIRLAAIRGLELLALRKKDPNALALLRETILKSSHPALIRESYLAYRQSSPGKGLVKARIAALLPPAKRQLLNVSRGLGGRR